MVDKVNNKLRQKMKIINRIQKIRELFDLGIREQEPRTALMLEKELQELETHLENME